MQTTIYTCDLCRAETKDAKDMYAPRNTKELSNAYVLEFIRKKFVVQDVCVKCFNSFGEMLNDNYMSLTHRK